MTISRCINGGRRRLLSSFIRKTSNLRKFSSEIEEKSEKQVNLLSEFRKLQNRGIVAITYPHNLLTDSTLLNEIERPTIYCGFDPTSDSLHVGNLLVLLTLFRLHAVGCEVIVIVGGATARLGDPSGKHTQRLEITKEQIDKNSQAINSQIVQLFENFNDYFPLENEPPLTPLRVLNNEMIYSEMNVIDFLSSICGHFRMGTMLKRQSIRERLNSSVGLSFTEFSYQVLQSYDWLKLYEQFGCRIQIGGTDQIGNFDSGYHLIKNVHQIECCGLSVPLITTEEGRKLGKTENNCIYLDSSKTSPFQLYQYFLRIKDSDVTKLLLLFTNYSEYEITEFCNSGAWFAQRKLAEFMTILVHGQKGLDSALRCTEALYSNPSIELLDALSSDQIEGLLRHVPTVTIGKDEQVTVEKVAIEGRCFQHANDTIHKIKDGALFVNFEKITDPNLVLDRRFWFKNHDITLLRVGRKSYTFVKWI